MVDKNVDSSEQQQQQTKSVKVC